MLTKATTLSELKIIFELISISSCSIGNTLVSVAMDKKKRMRSGKHPIKLMKCVLKCSSIVDPRVSFLQQTSAMQQSKNLNYVLIAMQASKQGMPSIFSNICVKLQQ